MSATLAGFEFRHIMTDMKPDDWLNILMCMAMVGFFGHMAFMIFANKMDLSNRAWTVSMTILLSLAFSGFIGMFIWAMKYRPDLHPCISSISDDQCKEKAPQSK